MARPSYEEIISTIEQFVGLYASEARVNYETGSLVGATWRENEPAKH
jgi:hypothetical protein